MKKISIETIREVLDLEPVAIDNIDVFISELIEVENGKEKTKKEEKKK